MPSDEIDRISGALNFIPSDDRDTWLKMGMAIKSELGDTGFGVWDEWSRQSDSYKSGDAAGVWKSIGPNGGVTVGTLFHEAKEMGWIDDGSYRKPTPDELTEGNRLAAERAAQEQTEIDRERADTANNALANWKAATEARPDHPYLQRKQVSPVATMREIDAGKVATILGYAPKSGGDPLTGRLLVIPVKQGKRLSTLELIDGDGLKAALAGRGSKTGGYWASEPLPDALGTLLIGEGVATALSAKEASGHPAIAALSAGNVPTVARAMSERYPAAELVILADLVKTTGDPDPHAVQAAQSVGGKLAIPDFGASRNPELTDFNDMALERGAKAVEQAIQSANGLAGVHTHPTIESASAGGLEWPELVPLGAPNLPRLDLEHLPAWAGDFAAALAAATETPPELAAGMVLTTCATAAARRLRVMVKPGYFESCNLWIVAALPSGNRKSAVQSDATAPLLSWERDQTSIMEPEIKRITSECRTLEARAKELRNKAAKEQDTNKGKDLAREAADIEAELPDVPSQPQLWTSDATPEKLGVLLADHEECMAWLSSEGGIFDLLQGRYSNGIPNLDLVLKAHSGDAERVHRGSRPSVYLQNPRLSIGLSPQPDVLGGLAAKPGFRGRGLLARFLYLLPPSPLGFRLLESNPVPGGVSTAYEAGIRAMLDWEPGVDENGTEQPHVLRLTNDAYAEWREFAKAIEKEMQPGNQLEHFTDWAGKAPGAAARLAGVLHGIKHAHGEPWQSVITAETMADALDIMAVFTVHSLAALDMMGADPTVAAARRIWHWIERNQLARFIIRDAHNALRGTFPRVKQLRDALAALEERGYVEVSDPPPSGPGRPPSPTVLVRPEIVRRWR